MKQAYNQQNITLTIFATVYTLIMSYGLDLVQAEASQIMPYIAWIQNPDLFQNDLMGLTLPYYGNYSLWYRFAGWLGLLLTPMGVVYLYFVLQCFIEVFALNFFAYKLFPEKSFLYRIIIIILFTFGGVFRYSIGSVAPFGWTVFPDALATGMLLFACGYLFEKKFIPAFILCALVFNIHLGVASFLMLVLSLMYVFSKKRYSISQIFYTITGASIIMLPTVLAVLNNPSHQFSLQHNEWLRIFKIHQGMHAFPSQFGMIQYIPFIFLMIVFVFSMKYIRKTEEIITLKIFCYSIVFILLIAFVFIEVLENRIAITLSFFRGSRFLTLAGVCCFTALIFEKKLTQIKLKKMFCISGICLIFSFVIVNILVFHPIYRIYPAKVQNNFADLENSNHPISKTLLFQAIKNDRHYVKAWKDAQVWCNRNTPFDSIILTPYHLRGFRTFSERSIFFQFRDANLVTYYYNVYNELQNRSEIINLSVTELDTPTQYQLALKKIYENYTYEDIQKIGYELNIKYVVTERKQSLLLPAVYQNDYFTIYEII